MKLHATANPQPWGTLVIVGGEGADGGSGASIASFGRPCCHRSCTRSWAGHQRPEKEAGASAIARSE